MAILPLKTESKGPAVVMDFEEEQAGAFWPSMLTQACTGSAPELLFGTFATLLRTRT